MAWGYTYRRPHDPQLQKAKDWPAPTAVAASTGVLAATQEADSAALAGTVGVGGTLAATQAGDTCAMVGTVIAATSGRTVNLFPYLFQWSPEFYQALQEQEAERKRKKRKVQDALDDARERKYQAKRQRAIKASLALLSMSSKAREYRVRVN